MSDKAPRRRSYHQFCSAARALDVVGERWTLLIVRNLLLGPRRYTDLKSELPGITTNLLAKRLKEMTVAGLIQHETLPAPLRAEVYSLTEAGLALEPVLMALGRWGGRLMDRPHRNDTMVVGSLLLSLKNHYHGGLDLEVELHSEEQIFELLFSQKTLRIQQRSARRPELVITASFTGLARLFFARESAASLMRLGLLKITGAPQALKAIVDAVKPIG
jgi:DNA-binding HxlR family transcriptional regulator